jgi:UTP--glucose-1-phosphate uridylyltransferase
MNLVNKCLFPVAGHGTRFLPITKSIPKEMLPILTKPLIQYGVEEAMNSGITSIAMVTSKNKQSIRDYFQINADIDSIVKGSSTENLLSEVNYIINNCDFTYENQNQMLGLGDAIYTGKILIGDEPFAVILPDDLCSNDGDSVIKQLISVYNQHPDCCIVAIEEVDSNEVSKYGVIDGDLINGSNNTFRVNSMIEKPKIHEAPSNLAIIGRYILTPEIFDSLEKTLPDKKGEIQITDALLKLAKEGKVLAYKFQGLRYDCGSVNGLFEAINFFANKNILIK